MSTAWHVHSSFPRRTQKKVNNKTIIFILKRKSEKKISSFVELSSTKGKKHTIMKNSIWTEIHVGFNSNSATNLAG